MKNGFRSGVILVAIAVSLSGSVAMAAPGGNSNGKGHGSCLGQDMRSEATSHSPGYMGDIISSDTQDKTSDLGYRWDPDGPRSNSIHAFFQTRCDTSGS